jgi:hypothetical protein
LRRLSARSLAPHTSALLAQATPRGRESGANPAPRRGRKGPVSRHGRGHHSARPPRRLGLGLKGAQSRTAESEGSPSLSALAAGARLQHLVLGLLNVPNNRPRPAPLAAPTPTASGRASCSAYLGSFAQTSSSHAGSAPGSFFWKAPNKRRRPMQTQPSGSWTATGGGEGGAGERSP